jgi:hypothetical protein
MLSLLIRQPDQVQIRNSDSASVNMTCGPQKNVRVVVEYELKQDKQFNTIGDVRTLDFTPGK